MNNKFVSNKTAKRLALGGAIGAITGVVLTLVILLPLYSKVGDCTTNSTSCSTNFSTEQIGVNLALGLVFVSAVAIITAAIMGISIHVKNKQ